MCIGFRGFRERIVDLWVGLETNRLLKTQACREAVTRENDRILTSKTKRRLDIDNKTHDK